MTSKKPVDAEPSAPKALDDHELDDVIGAGGLMSSSIMPKTRFPKSSTDIKIEGSGTTTGSGLEGAGTAPPGKTMTDAQTKVIGDGVDDAIRDGQNNGNNSNTND